MPTFAVTSPVTEAAGRRLSCSTPCYAGHPALRGRIGLVERCSAILDLVGGVALDCLGRFDAVLHATLYSFDNRRFCRLSLIDLDIEDDALHASKLQ